MKGMIFAAGLGTRLRPLTDSCPKALVKVGGEAMLGRIIKKLDAAGADEMVVNVHHFAPMVKEYLKQFEGDVKIKVSDESDLLLDTGGGVAGASELLEGADCVILHNADVLTDFDVEAMLRRHRESGADAILAVWGRESSRCFLFDESGRLRGWKNRNSGEVKPAGVNAEDLNEMAFGGVHVISAGVIDKLKEYASEHGKVFSITQFYLEKSGELDVRAYTPNGDFKWFDIGSLEKLAAAEKYVGSLRK